MGETMIHRYPHTLNPYAYRYICTKRNFPAVRQKKEKLREKGYRVKYRKNEDGFYDIFIKDVIRIALQRDQGNGRVHV